MTAATEEPPLLCTLLRTCGKREREERVRGCRRKRGKRGRKVKVGKITRGVVKRGREEGDLKGQSSKKGRGERVKGETMNMLLH